MILLSILNCILFRRIEKILLRSFIFIFNIITVRFLALSPIILRISILVSQLTDILIAITIYSFLIYLFQ